MAKAITLSVPAENKKPLKNLRNRLRKTASSVHELVPEPHPLNTLQGAMT